MVDTTSLNVDLFVSSEFRNDISDLQPKIIPFSGGRVGGLECRVTFIRNLAGALSPKGETDRGAER